MAYAIGDAKTKRHCVFEQGAYLCQHATVASVHLTGSAATYNAIVWGDNKDKARLFRDKIKIK